MRSFWKALIRGDVSHLGVYGLGLLVCWLMTLVGLYLVARGLGYE